MVWFDHWEVDENRILLRNKKGQNRFYKDIGPLAQRLKKQIGRKLVFLLCRNDFGSILGYLSCLQAHLVPLLLGAEIDQDQLQDLLDLFHLI